jgi:hypothetical protein
MSRPGSSIRLLADFLFSLLEGWKWTVASFSADILSASKAKITSHRSGETYVTFKTAPAHYPPSICKTVKIPSGILGLRLHLQLYARGIFEEWRINLFIREACLRDRKNDRKS